MKESSYIIKVITLLLAYYISGTVGLSLDAVSGFATYVWIPTGLSLAALLVFGYRLWPGVFLGALLVNLSQGGPLPVVAGIAVGNTLEALAGTFLLERAGFNKELISHRDILKLIVYGAFISTFISAVVGSLSLLFGRIITLGALLPTWSAWWVGDIVSDLIFAPVILLWTQISLVRNSNKPLELAAFLTAVFIMGFLIFRGLVGIEVRDSQIIYLVFPFIIWSAIRFDQKVAVTTVLIFSLLAVWGTAAGFGPFAGRRLVDSLYFLQSFMGITAITSMLLAAAFEETREADKRKDDFISIVSHELKTPITTIKGYAQIMKKNTRGKKALYLARINQQSDKLVNLVNDLLNLSKIQRQTFEVKHKKFSLKVLLQEIIEEIEVANKSHKVILKGETNRNIYGDRERIEQVIINLLTNAIKYSPNKKTVQVEVKPLRKKIQIAVQDRGIGIDDKHVGKIFELFYRADALSLPGLGIGLYLSKYIVGQHNGKMWLKSRKGRGSTFYFTLPTKIPNNS